jgi:hypothetical protein
LGIFVLLSLTKETLPRLYHTHKITVNAQILAGAKTACKPGAKSLRIHNGPNTGGVWHRIPGTVKRLSDVITNNTVEIITEEELLKKLNH